MPLENASKIILILSGKGGVGKSSITTQLALTLCLQGHSVGVLDVDLTGPSIPRFFGIEGAKVTQAPGGLVPVPVHPASTASAVTNGGAVVENGNSNLSYGRLDCMSLGFILSSRNTAVIWRGPKKTAMVRQFLTSTLWPRLDYLLIDTPPGTSDEHISLLETLLKETASDPSQLAGAVVVTTPQAISISDVKKELNFCVKTGVKVLGVVENMAGFVCPHCAECTNVFSKGGGEVMARDFGVPFLGSLPIDPAFVALIEEGTRPVYPLGTREMLTGEVQENILEQNEAARHDEEDGRAVERDEGRLVEKYMSCSLYPLFDEVVKKVLV